MKKITLIDYYGNCDASGRSIGHSHKVLDEYRALFQKAYQIEAILPQCIIAEINCSLFSRVQRLPYQIVEEGNRSFGKRLLDKIKLFINISECLKKSDDGILWFYRTDFFLFFFFFLHRKPVNKKMICLVCQQKFAGGILGDILNCIYQKGLQKFDGIIYTQKSMQPKHTHTFYMPDYYYDEEKYGKYHGLKKEIKVVCLGTMSPYKKLEELVDAFNQNGIPLEIVGKFFDEERYERLQKNAKSNILIQNTILTEEEYYRKLAGAQYTILPYDVQQYAGRTSGVLIEALFMQTIPIAPFSLLEENGMPGIGYENLQELEKVTALEANREDIADKLKRKLREYPKKEEIKKGILEFIDKV